MECSAGAFICAHLNLIADQLCAKSGHSMACRQPQMNQVIASGHLSGWQYACSHDSTAICRVPILPSLRGAASCSCTRSTRSES